MRILIGHDGIARGVGLYVIVFLLIVIIVILLFGSPAVLGAASGAIRFIGMVLGAFVLVYLIGSMTGASLGTVMAWGAGVLMVIAVIGALIGKQKPGAATYVARPPAEKPKTPHHVLVAMERDKRLADEHRAKIAERAKKS